MENKIEISGFADEIAEDLKTQIEVIKKLGISHIEMRGVNGKPLVEHSLEEVKEAVSYTHLDVYKRQVVSFIEARIEI